jgi:hypothetical protein
MDFSSPLRFTSLRKTPFTPGSTVGFKAYGNSVRNPHSEETKGHTRICVLEGVAS